MTYREYLNLLHDDYEKARVILKMACESDENYQDYDEEKLGAYIRKKLDEEVDKCIIITTQKQNN